VKKETKQDGDKYARAWREHLNNKPSEVNPDKRTWTVEESITPEDSNSVIKVIYSDEVGFSKHTIYCNVVWVEKKAGNYKCTAPWIGKYKLIKKSNILDIEFKKVSKEEAGL
jgi:hypothetical protein